MLPRVAVNLSGARLNDTNLVYEIKNSGIDPQRLVIEFLESVSIENVNKFARAKLNELFEMGVAIAMDDFGTGHASIQGLLEIKPSILKIDRQFIKHIATNEVSRSMISSMVAIGKSLGLSIVAEGVESDEHAQVAAAMGCDYLQGFYFGKPMSVSDFRSALNDTKGQFWSPHPMQKAV